MKFLLSLPSLKVDFFGQKVGKPGFLAIFGHFQTISLSRYRNCCVYKNAFCPKKVGFCPVLKSKSGQRFWSKIELLCVQEWLFWAKNGLFWAFFGDFWLKLSIFWIIVCTRIIFCPLSHFFSQLYKKGILNYSLIFLK